MKKVLAGILINILLGFMAMASPGKQYEITPIAPVPQPHPATIEVPCVNPCLLVDATMYHPVAAQTDDTPTITADGTKIDPYHTSELNIIAVSQDMLERNGGFLNYGDTVVINNAGHKNGTYTIHDCMASYWTNKIDFFESVGTPIYKFNAVEIEKI